MILSSLTIARDKILCPRCHKHHFNEINFYLKPQNIRLTANYCKVCSYLWSEDDEMLKAIRKHLKWLVSPQAREHFDE